MEISRLVDFRTEANSGSITSSRLSSAPGSWPLGSRTFRTSPSPLERPVVSLEGNAGSTSESSLVTWSSELPFRARLESPINSRNWLV